MSGALRGRRQYAKIDLTVSSQGRHAMTKVALVGLAFVLAVTVTVWTPGGALADGRGGGGGFKGDGFKGDGRGQHGQRLHSVPPKVYPPPRFFNHQNFRGGPYGNGYGNGYGYGYGGYGSSYIAYGTPGYATPLYAPPAYEPPPAYVPAPPTYAPPASYAPPATETVIEFPSGRWELRGDGVATPYRWVWVPNPPAAPPSGSAPDRAPRATAAPEPTRPMEFFRWTDDAGVVHLTDRLDKVPEAYRAKVTKSHS